ncbi:MAG: hypothetical protein A2Y38_22225 [Spirochaetes bacterium GWB1_59_5]|nr:MAG: hypothetical protein A2Y38_22225 [Spirochaetes bacterium GWB1_59_5]
MATLTFKQAEALADKGRPWTFKMQFQGLDPSNASGQSDKFWLATGRGKGEPVEIHFGATGTVGQVQVHDWAYVAAKVPEKEAKGYRYVDTLFVRVRQTTIDLHNAHKGAAMAASNSQPAGASVNGWVAPTVPAQAPLPALAPPTPVPAPWSQQTMTGGCNIIDPVTNIRIALAILPTYILVEFEQYPLRAGGFQTERALIEKAAGSCQVKWVDNPTFHVMVARNSHQVLDQLRDALQDYVGIARPAPLVAKADPYDRIVSVIPPAATGGNWRALDGADKFVMWLTPKGARQLVQQNPAVKVAGLG